MPMISFISLSRAVVGATADQPFKTAAKTLRAEHPTADRPTTRQ